MTSPEWEAANEDDADRYPQTPPQPARPATHSPEQAENGSTATGHATGAREARYAKAATRALANVSGLPDWFAIPALGRDLSPLGERIGGQVIAVADAEQAELRAEVERLTELYRDASVRLDEQRRMTDAAEAEAKREYEHCRWHMADKERLNEENQRLRGWIDRAEAAEDALAVNSDALRSLRERIEALADGLGKHRWSFDADRDVALTGIQNRLTDLLATSPAATTGEATHTPGWPCGGQIKRPACCAAPASSGEAGTVDLLGALGRAVQRAKDDRHRPAPVVAPSDTEGGA